MARRSETKDLGGTEVTIRQMAPRAALRLGARLGRVAGPLLAQVVTVGGIRHGDDVIPWQALEHSREAVDALLQEVASMLSRLDPDDLVSLAEDALIGHCSIRPPHMATPVEVKAAMGSGDLLDDLVGDVSTLLGALMFALRVHLLPTTGTEPG